jgi:crotonobetainyl-CoA:carnitine CoA-transferase CaiB-like acyl-CoA transferase
VAEQTSADALPLHDLHVVEISANAAAGTAGKYFADWGAQVTVLEPPGGSELRNWPPYYEVDGERRSGLHAWLSRNKTSYRVGPGGNVTLDQARQLCENADVVLIDAEAVERVLGIAPRDVRPWLEGRTIAILISPFASDGPYASYHATDLGLAALGGWMTTFWLGTADRAPIRPGGEMTYRYGGLFAFATALIALRQLWNGGATEFGEVSLQAVATHGCVAPWIVKRLTGVEQLRAGTKFPSAPMECKDGWVACPPLTSLQWEMFCVMNGIADVLELPGGRTATYRMEHGPELAARVRPQMLGRTRLEVVKEAQSYRIPAAGVESVSERLHCPQLEARGFWAEVDIDGRRVRVPRVPNRISGITARPSLPLAEPPALETSLLQRRRQEAPVASTPPPARPLEGIRVLDLTHFWAGPSATALLGMLGADVIKIESIQRPDAYRYSVVIPEAERPWESGCYWPDANCNKRSLTLNLGSEEGKAIFERLAQQADVVIDNFSNRVMSNLGLDAARLHQLNPRLLIVTVPGFGAGGPWENYVGYGVTFEQLAVVASITGYPDLPPMIMGGVSDPIAGLHGVMSILLGLRLRDETGRGSTIEVPQCETLDSLFGPEHIAVQHGAPDPQRRANRHDWMAPHNAYQVAGDDEWLTIAIRTDEEFRALTQVLGLPALATDPRFATVEARKAHEREIDTEIAAAVRTADLVTLERCLQAAGVCAARVMKAWFAPEDPGLAHVGLFQEMEREYVGRFPQRGVPFRFTSLPTSQVAPPPTLGQDNHAVLRTILGLSDDEIATLEATLVIGTKPLGE